MIEPLGGVGMTAPGTGAVIAGVVDKLLAAAVATEELSAQGGSAAGENGLDSAPVRGQQARSKLAFIRRPMAAQDFSQRDQAG